MAPIERNLILPQDYGNHFYSEHVNLHQCMFFLILRAKLVIAYSIFDMVVSPPHSEHT